MAWNRPLITYKPLGEFIINSGHHLVLVANGAVKQNRELLDGRWDKNDTKDCANAADLISQGKFLYYDLPGPEILNLRNLASLKKKLKAQEHSIRMRIRNHLVTQFFPELDEYYGKREGENLAIVKWCLNPEQIAAMEFEQFFQMVTKRNTGAAQRERLRSIQEAARRSIGCQVTESAMFEAKMLVEHLGRVREMITETDARIAALCRQLPGYQSLMSIPGFGSDRHRRGDDRPWQSPSLYQQQTGAQARGPGPVGQPQRQELGKCRGKDIEEGQGSSPVCPVSVGAHRNQPEQIFCRVLVQTDCRSGERTGNQDKNAGQGGSENAGYCLDPVEKRRGLSG